jgi:SAM-dependent methyltransferase
LGNIKIIYFQDGDMRASRGGNDIPGERSPAYHELAEFYDVIDSQHPHYQKEFDFLVAAFDRFGQDRIRRVLDLACGTGHHSIFLAGKGYDVMGLDISEKMLDIAQKKVQAAGHLIEDRIEFVLGDVLSLNFDEEFDAVICIGQTTMMLTEFDYLQRLFKGIFKSLRPGGLLIMDFLSWYNKGSFTDTVNASLGGKDLRIENEEIFDPIRQILHHKSKYYVTDRGKTTQYEGYGEDRIFYPREILIFLREIGGFQIQGMYDCWDPDKEPENDYLVIIARKD